MWLHDLVLHLSIRVNDKFVSDLIVQIILSEMIISFEMRMELYCDIKLS